MSANGRLSLGRKRIIRESCCRISSVYRENTLLSIEFLKLSAIYYYYE